MLPIQDRDRTIKQRITVDSIVKDMPAFNMRHIELGLGNGRQLTCNLRSRHAV